MKCDEMWWKNMLFLCCLRVNFFVEREWNMMNSKRDDKGDRSDFVSFIGFVSFYNKGFYDCKMLCFMVVCMKRYYELGFDCWEIDVSP